MCVSFMGGSTIVTKNTIQLVTLQGYTNLHHITSRTIIKEGSYYRSHFICCHSPLPIYMTKSTCYWRAGASQPSLATADFSFYLFIYIRPTVVRRVSAHARLHYIRTCVSSLTTVATTMAVEPHLHAETLLRRDLIFDEFIHKLVQPVMR